MAAYRLVQIVEMRGEGGAEAAVGGGGWGVEGDGSLIGKEAELAAGPVPSMSIKKLYGSCMPLALRRFIVYAY